MTSPKSNGNVINLTLPSRLELLGVVDKITDGITEFLGFEDVDRDAVAISVIISRFMTFCEGRLSVSRATVPVASQRMNLGFPSFVSAMERLP